MKDLLSLYHDSVPPVLQALAQTPPMDRLRRVGMNCGCEYTAFPRFRGGRSYHRFDHSLGVGLIVWHFTADPAQAAAGLLHDIATPVFAHVVDFLRGDYLTQEATESGTGARIAESRELAEALARFGLCPEEVEDYHRYPVADNDSPRLSADRLEYTLGNAGNYGFLTAEQIASIYADLTVAPAEDGEPELQFRSPAAGLLFARAALACSRVYVSPEDRYAMQRLCELLKRALSLGVLSEKDLDTDEPSVIARLKDSSLSEAWSAFCRMGRVFTAPVPPDDRPWRRIPAKKRRIDPLILGQGRASSLDPRFAADLSSFLAEPQTDWLLAE